MTILELENVTVRSKESGNLILDSVSLKLEEGQKILIRGQSGSGKTTLFHAILGGIPVDSGTIRFRGDPITKQNIRDVRRQIAAVSQEPVLSGENVREALLLPFSFREHCGKRPSPELISTLLSTLGLGSDFLDQAIPDLSGGEKQRVAIVRALLLETEVFLLDEVTSALDPANRDRVIEVLSVPGYTVLSISHDRSWEGKSDEIGSLNQGRITWETESRQ